MRSALRYAGFATAVVVLIAAIIRINGGQADGDRWHLSMAANFEIPANAEPETDKPQPLIQQSHTDRVSDIAFSSKAGLMATAGDRYIDIWNTRTWTLERTIALPVMRSEGFRSYNTKALAFSPDGKSLAYLSPAGNVQIWDPFSGTLVRTLSESVDIPVSAAWSPGGRFIAVGGLDGASGGISRLWDAKSGKLLRTFSVGGDLAFSNDGKILGVAGEFDVALFSVTAGKRLRTIKDKSGVQGPIAFSPDGKLIATGGEDPNWDPGPYPKDETGQEYAPSEAFYSHELKVKVWDAHTGKLIRMLPGHHNLSGGTLVLQFSPDSRRLFSSGDGYSGIWDVKTGKSLANFGSSYASAISPDFKLYATAGEEVTVYDAATEKKITTLQSPPVPIRSIAFSPDGKFLASGEQWGNTSLHIWDVENGRLLYAMQGPPPDLYSVSFLSDNRLMANSLNGVWILDVPTRKIITRMTGPKEKEKFWGPEQKWALLTPDGSKLISESGVPFRTSYVVKDVKGSKLDIRLSVGREAGSIGEAAFSPDGQYMIIGSGFKPHRLLVLNLETGKQESELQDVPDGAVLMAFSPDSKTVAASLPSSIRMPAEELVGDNRLVLWDRETGKIKRKITLEKDQEHAARTLAYSSDGRVIAAGMVNEIRLFSADTLDTLGKIETESTVSAIAFSPDSKRIAAGDEDGKIRLWDLEKRRLLITMIGFPAVKRDQVSQDWLAYTPEGFYDWSPGASRLITWKKGGKIYPANAFEKEFRRKNLLTGSR